MGAYDVHSIGRAYAKLSLPIANRAGAAGLDSHPRRDEPDDHDPARLGDRCLARSSVQHDTEKPFDY